MKICCRCKRELDLDQFHGNVKSKDGKQHHCKDCKRELGRIYDKNRAAKKSYYDKLQYHERRKNDSKYLAIQKKWKQENKEYIAEQAKKYREENKLYLLVKNSNSRAKKHGYIGKLTQAEWRFVLGIFGEKCLCCDGTNNLSIDHVVPLSIGGPNLVTNIQPLCLKCHMKKGTRVVDFRFEDDVRIIREKYPEQPVG